jgi:fructose-specific phosphotransferase system IIA component
MQDMVLSDLSGQNAEQVLKELIDFLKKRNKITRGKELFEKLVQRENLGSTAIGKGFAIPHCKQKAVSKPLVVLAVSKSGIDFKSMDKKPTHIFFLVVSSPENPSLNLQILAAIAHLVRKSVHLKKKILEAQSIEEVLEVIRSEEEKIHE